ncbi:hypothetical protein LEN26_019410 [Aphanomyces euteiches]|nr:hypothetical protein LEN26_019410 [Aphanomyces euteiches]KAH9128481.1 hypothetical protein AeMF1_001365 [Aphanomyces euteiches]KAH9195621.1 hypothetical protein AeNC1_002405 [Aphanomyces euteiches]
MAAAAETVDFSKAFCELSTAKAVQYPVSTLTANCSNVCANEPTTATGFPLRSRSYCLIALGKVFAASNSVPDDYLAITDLQNQRPISTVEALPSQKKTVYVSSRLPIFKNLGISSLGKSLGAGNPLTVSLELTNNSIASLAGTSFPSGLSNLIVDQNKLVDISNISAPALTSLSVKSNQLVAIPPLNLPKLISLSMDNNSITSLQNITWPVSSNITALSFAGNNITELTPSVNLPASLVTLNLQNNALSRVLLTTLPATLQVLCLGGNANLTSFTVSSAAYNVLKNLNQPHGVASALNTSNCDASSPFASMAQLATTCGSDSQLEKLWDTFSICVQQTAEAAATSTKSNASIIIVCVSLAFIVLLVIATCFIRRRARHVPHWYEEVDNKYYGLVDESHLDSDIRYDEMYAPFHIPAQTIERHQILARGGFGIVYLATLHPSPAYPVITSPVTVAMKRMLPEKACEVHAVEDFMEEIRLNARLYHKNIVKFIGYSWTTLQNLSALTEYMDNGDLWSYMTAVRPFGWDVHPSIRLRHDHSSSVMFSKSSFTNSVLSLASKPEVFDDTASTRASTSPASLSKFTVLCDVVEAIVYLHSMDPPIIHRDLKTKNVLLNTHGVAKLTDFGVSRETSEDTMTAEIGTVAWIAPEVLKGVYYSEKADIYSLGVMISEMDTVEVPYGNLDQIFPEFQAPMDIHTAKTRIAMLVVAGDLRPTITTACPPSVADVAARCLSYDPDRRPHIYQVWDWLKQIKQAMPSSTTTSSSLSSALPFEKKI